MRELDQLIALLDKPDDELWGSIWMDDALCLLQLSQANLIPQALNNWQGWPLNRQEHLACILGSIGSIQEKQLISEMLTSTASHVLSRAQEAEEEWGMTVEINRVKNA